MENIVKHEKVDYLYWLRSISDNLYSIQILLEDLKNNTAKYFNLILNPITLEDNSSTREDFLMENSSKCVIFSKEHTLYRSHISSYKTAYIFSAINCLLNQIINEFERIVDLVIDLGFSVKESDLLNYLQIFSKTWQDVIKINESSGVIYVLEENLKNNLEIFADIRSVFVAQYSRFVKDDYKLNKLRA